MYKALYTNYSQNPDLVNQVSHLKFNNPIYLVKDKEGDASERDKSSNFLIFLSNENKVIASARIQILEAEKEGSLNYDSKFTYDMFKDFFIPGLEVNNLKGPKSAIFWLMRRCRKT
jgi:hypothetical protein